MSIDMSDAQNSTTRATSSATPMRPSGVRSSISLTNSSMPGAVTLAMNASRPSVCVMLGATASTRTPAGPNSTAVARVRPTTACFDVM